jgi:hypothetical protein
MDKKPIIEAVLKAYRARSNNLFGGGGASWAFQSQSTQPDLNQAIKTWLEQDDPEQLIGVISIMQTTGVLSEAEADALLQKLNTSEEQ